MAQRLDIDPHGSYEERWGWRDPTNYKYVPKKGLTREVVEEISFLKSEPKWMRDFRLKAYDRYERRPMPRWMAPDLTTIDLDDIYYFMRAVDAGEQGRSWDDVPPDIKKTFDRLGIPEAEQKYLGGVSAQYECVVGDTRVRTPTGERCIRDLEPGDDVLSLDETSGDVVPTRVLGQRRSGQKQVFAVRAGGATVIASANHPFLASRGGRRSWVPLESLAVGELVAALESGPDTSAGGIATLQRLKLSFVVIEAIEARGVESVYDIEVEGHHNFVAEGFVVHNSEVVYHKVKGDLEAKGVIFTDMDSAVRDYPDIVRRYIATVIPVNDNKLAALNSAVWSGGSMIYVPPGVQVDVPLQAYFRINAESMGQFERTLIIADEGAYVHYVEGCTAPVYSSNSLHSAVVELIALPHARIRYTTIQNWAGNVFNLVTKRARAEENSVVEWVDGNLGSKVTVKYPAVVLTGRKAHGEVLSLAMAGAGQHQDTGAKMTHVAPETTSTIISKSISKDGGITTYRGGVWIKPGAHKAKSNVRCDALLLDEESVSNTFPYMDVQENDVEMGHEATVARIGDEQLFYLRSRGIPEADAAAMIVRGFIEPITKQLPMEYAVELNRLIELQMEGSVG